MNQKRKRGQESSQGRTDITLNECSFFTNSTSFELKRFRSAQGLEILAPRSWKTRTSQNMLPLNHRWLDVVVPPYMWSPHTTSRTPRGFALTQREVGFLPWVGPPPLKISIHLKHKHSSQTVEDRALKHCQRFTYTLKGRAVYMWPNTVYHFVPCIWLQMK